ncbi:uncharacterized protein L3040_001926 [Drepanopeziza brunnea f. sp. 'multigermtubi']|uniref:C6 zinc finger domain containing protein n=1 Tax=Marssonina brunnea f. sp. multigermtubi (strain MB_m1) TaxID=1072389 RepID=K1X3D4_MARBU|nr:c6 zinc finger domain containing protein [Drepanopeziza brunnea f. sp. 'multigermtubi' MB_m1]EKD19726.1 c6 zinc finger domain containing protein [Drepanopeziza brunnea f. sp. 'multigermtubi' MB_m1]KAJ5052167.1 hypothetical protein L3040_001926 [Drepanopeziza brunnea f. sp. 'multigermtubi']
MENCDEFLEASPPNSPEHSVGPHEEQDREVRKPGSKGKGRKRTKTGCLTCRKRRIKCGEEKPTCANCAKSKRQCEGYNMRVVFKDPMSTYHPSMGPPPPPPYLPKGQSSSRRESHPQPGSGQVPLPIAPKPSKAFSASLTSEQAAACRGNERRGSAEDILPSNSRYNNREKPRLKIHLQDKVLDRTGDAHVLDSLEEQESHYDFNALVQQEGVESAENHAYTPSRTYSSDWSGVPTPLSSQPHHLPTKWDSDFLTTFGNPFPAPDHITLTSPRTPQVESFTHQLVHPQPTYPRDWKGGHHAQVCPPQTPDWSLSQPQRVPTANDMEDLDDPFDVSDGDEDMDMAEHDHFAHGDQDIHLKKNDLGIVVAVQAGQDKQGLNLRSFVSFIDRPDMLATYTPSSQSTPLRDPMTARIFCHFVNVTGPSMSMYERHPANPSLIFQGSPVLKSQQHIWTYTFPTLALQNSGLLHAMLAIATLHISKLQSGPVTASYKHYALSLRRIAKSVSLPTRRGHPATLAAALLLSFYECWAADHQKWTDHLLGAKQLVKEIDFAGLTGHIKRKRDRKRQHDIERFNYAQNHGLEFDFDEQSHTNPADEVDENVVGVLMGTKVSYNDYGKVLGDSQSHQSREKYYTERDVEIYETQRDLFWWYAKQDTYQSILGGGKLFLEYSFWSHCPPRAPLGRLNAIYGTFDHMILLLGRLADFASKDLKRKRLAMKVNGGRWQPPASMQAQPPPRRPPEQSTPHTPHTPQHPPPQMPNFSGMVPDVREPRLPMGFEPLWEASPQETHSEDADLYTQTHAANEEWQEIRDAFDLIQSHFGDDFQALGPEFTAPIPTPFGPALQYRTYGIAGIWMNFYMGLITCYRAHPSMPPAAIMAAGISAPQTGRFANELGRIAAGIAPDLSMTTEVNPGVGAALMESSTCMFVSAVQLQVASQREWTVCRLRDIARLTGWQTALAVATGCETSWVKMGELGRGPPYTRTTERRVVPDIWASARRIDVALEGKTDEEKMLVMAKSDRVQYALGVLGLEEDFEGLDVGRQQR